MKQCPVCKTTYTDDSLQYCLSDGGSLQFVRDEEETVQIPGNRVPIQFDLPNNNVPVSVPTITANAPVKKGCSPLLIGGLLVLLLALFGGVVAAVYFFAPFGEKNVSGNSANANNSQISKSNANTDDLNGRIANLQKQIEEQQKNKADANKKTSPVPTASPASTVSGTTASVAPTGDGFLSLRTEPSVKTGAQLIKIPTGATVSFLGKCQNPGQTVEGKKGRWCLVSYNNQTGWVFDAYLIY